MHSVPSKICPSTIKNSGNLLQHSGRLLGSQRRKLLVKPMPNNRKFDRGFIYKAIKSWNVLTEEIKGIVNIHKFRTRVVCELRQGKLNFPE